MHRFFVSRGALEGDEVALPAAVAHQLRNVLRMSPGAHIVVLDNSGWEYEVELTEVAPQGARGRIVSRSLSTTEPRTKITLYQSFLKGQRFEFVLQKGTELGIVEFVPVISARCVVSSLEHAEHKAPRWEKIIREAAEQSRRGRLPELAPALFFREACLRATRAGQLALIPWEGETTTGLRHALDRTPRPFSVSLFVGPEGGFEEAEIALARDAGVIPVRLGPRILRAETAGLVAASAILFAYGDLE
ncbi:MAG: 16S rRNA (uracil(1498)-N(3))-methyltransferase [Anaerolineae bacterium]|nr:16S rRNA (uracil(1498)-N(3))-methyltransferase [Anaerolineae bacterium]